MSRSSRLANHSPRGSRARTPSVPPRSRFAIVLSYGFNRPSTTKKKTSAHVGARTVRRFVLDARKLFILLLPAEGSPPALPTPRPASGGDPNIADRTMTMRGLRLSEHG